ncbi:B3 domain-containing protein At3g19184 isoform X2 [Hevea brasiliensis]|uniref:B3 domain-containing protein At3g19184 isoform X2 n=1 Tax=Hevea brasiliensis TaxID=3981 RepID=UPI000B78A111|nr:B3 domain-containing protein At3g19184 isoform X2 [Hevea brasiliensis]
MVVSKSKYEEIRQKRLEENKKRMEELNLKKLAVDLRTTSPKTSPAKQVKPRLPRSSTELVPVRRSSRFADKTPVSYKEVAPEPLERPRRSYSYQRRDLLNRIYASDEVRAYAIDRAEQVQSGLEADFPSFVKPMTQSHVTGGFWLGLPVQFCKDHLPSRDEYITLVDENGDASETKYLAQKTGLSAGWRGFAIDHKLVDGDALVFQLVSPREFKVYIIRAYESEDNEDKENDKENNEEPGQDVDVTPLNRSAKRTRASRN